ncbi:MAG: methylaspartate ammonia-lyase [Alphaproteobacteria bacterium]|nr:MAG: methylaspartate ammonia-lyase [Alphaproteobacteria bacterium]
MKIIDVLLAPANGAFFYDDQLAIRSGVDSDGFIYKGDPITSGFSNIRMLAGALSIGLILSDGTIVWGDMMSVQYSGTSGRDPLFNVENIEANTRTTLIPRLIGLSVGSFLSACKTALAHDKGKRLPLSIEYGVSQALLRAAAHAAKKSMAEVICESFTLSLPTKSVPLYAQSGDNRHVNVDKMIMRSVDILPHGLINSYEKFGPQGSTFIEFAKWVVSRIETFGGSEYNPTLHFDLYGWVGLEIGEDPNDIAEFIAKVSDELAPYPLNIECPADYGSTDAQLEGYRKIVEALKRLGSPARIVADEHCNTLNDIQAFVEHNAAHIVQIKMPDVGSIVHTIEAVLHCKKFGVGAYVGGSCVETDLSAQVSTHIAVATQADMMLAKPGMGVDEGMMIVGNEQSRLLTALKYSRDKVSHSSKEYAQ